MEIHAPEHPIHTWRDFFTHLATITIGLLIALGLEGLVEIMHWRHVVHEAESSITAELTDNKEQIDAVSKTLADEEKDHRKVLQFVSESLIKGKSAIKGFNLSHRITGISDTSWQTAQAVGALAHFDYAEVKRYSGVYNLQRHFETVEQKALDNVLVAITSFANQESPKLSQPDLRRAREQLLTSLSSLEAERQIAGQLSQAYGEALGRKDKK